MNKKLPLKKRWERTRKAWKEHVRRAFQRLFIRTLAPLKINGDMGYVISLTSYGERITDTCPYTIYSLFNQSVKPDKIVLWIGHNDKEKVSPLLRKLVQKGLEIRFCEDIRSYTKIIYALAEFPDACIITADDDIRYSKKWLKRLIAEHEKNPEKIICNRAHGIKTDEQHNPLPYNKWFFCIKPATYFGIEKQSPFSIFPTGVGGILYPPQCFHKDIANKELFMRLAPFADDIWLWAMVVINEKFSGESPYVVVGKGDKGFKFSIAKSQQRYGTALYQYNLLQGGNDWQLKEIIAYYPQLMETLKRIMPIKTKINSDK